MKCVNCGAEVVGSVCEYCGSHYEGNRITATFDSDKSFGTLTIDGNTYEVYISEIQYEHLFPIGFPRDVNGRLTPIRVKQKRKFTLIER